MDTQETTLSRSEDAAPVVATRQETVLIYARDEQRRAELVDIVLAAGWWPLIAVNSGTAMRIVGSAPPDLVVVALSGTSGNELELVNRVRNHPNGERTAIVCLLDRKHRGLTIEAFEHQADDVVSGHPHESELMARLRSRIERRPVPQSDLVEDPVTGALTDEAFAQQLRKEHERVQRGGRPGALAFLSLDELPGHAARHGSRARDELLAQLVALIKVDGRRLDFVGVRRGVISLLLPDTPKRGAQARFDRLAKVIYEREFELDGSTTHLTPLIGFTETVGDAPPGELEDRAWDALVYQSDQLDLHPTRWVKAMSRTGAATERPWFERIRTPSQVAFQQLAVFAIPFLVYVTFGHLGLDITGGVYLVLVVALAFTALSIWVECRAALERPEPPPAPDEPPPLASAVIAAYLPNEADTVIETVEAFLGQDYPDLEIILAYNTPRPLPVEHELRAIADRDPRFLPLRVDGSVSKAQNVNAALARVSGTFVGLFDADHHPAPGSFHRAWRWLAGGAGVVQGHCVIRNGDTNFVTRLVATEFESIYAVSHPGRAKLHGFGIFGGSNGYWRTSLLHRTRLRGSMLTEDIDSSMRVVQAGEEIISDPDLVSTELAPDTVGALWNQRLRWAQGWSQVSLRHLGRMIRAVPTLRQKLGVMYLLGWREIYPWISLQMIPLLSYWWMRGQPPMNWFVPIFVLTSLFTLSAGPAQVWYARRLAHPTIRKERRWFVIQLLSSIVFYTELKNIIARTAHLKEAMRERKWKVTPRSSSPSPTTADVTSQNERSTSHIDDDIPLFPITPATPGPSAPPRSEDASATSDAASDTVRHGSDDEGILTDQLSSG